jgi:hypothetical protein
MFWIKRGSFDAGEAPRRSTSSLGMSMRCVAIFLIAIALSPLCFAETWVEVRHGAFAASNETLTQIRTTLKETVVAAMRAKGAKPPDWDGYLIQYRGATINGQRAIEIHGSCRFDGPRSNDRSQFYDEGVSDGGTCYFLVYFAVETKRYSNVVFHGYG